MVMKMNEFRVRHKGFSELAVVLMKRLKKYINFDIQVDRCSVYLLYVFFRGEARTGEGGVKPI
jgi:hypothetical protein